MAATDSAGVRRSFRGLLASVRMHPEGHQAKAGKECGYPLKVQTIHFPQHVEALKEILGERQAQWRQYHVVGSLLHLLFWFSTVWRDYDPGCHLSAGNVTVDSLTSPKVVQIHIKSIED